MRQLAHFGVDVVAAELGRSHHAVRRMASRKRISLRRSGERRGLVLGQPRGMSWKHLRDVADLTAALRTIREQAIAREIDIAELEQRVLDELAVERGELTLCPQCAARPASVRRTGLCHVCHLRRLAQQHRGEHQRIQDAQRELWRERQRRKRSREPKDA